MAGVAGTIVSNGTTTSEVESYLGLKTAIDIAVADGKRFEVLIKAVEAFMKAETGRKFKETTYTAEIYDVIPEQEALFLSDHPVSVFTKLEWVTDRDNLGVVTLETITKDDYVVDLDGGILMSLSGAFPDGPQALRATYTAGYNATDITNSTKDEIAIWKLLELSLIAREWGLSKEPKRHLESISFGGEAPRFQFDLDPNQRRLLALLKRHKHMFR